MSIFSSLDPRMMEIILNYPPLANRLKTDAEREKAIKMVREIRSAYSRWYIKPLIKLLDFTLANLYDGIDVSYATPFDMAQLVRENNVVLVPNHQSHADYIALNYIFNKQFDLPVYIAGGINLNILLIGYLFRKCGCFFIRRTFARDILYKLVLEAYLYFLLHDGQAIEFFFEGGRSRTGKLLEPRYGLYQILLEAHEAIDPAQRKEMVFVPVSIIHEYLPEQKSLGRELQGGKKKKENIFQVMKIVEMFYEQFGSVHLRFGTPVKVRPYLPDIKDRVKALAFDCFLEVGSNMLVTPSALLSLVMLNMPNSAAMTLPEILGQMEKILSYCRQFNIPLSTSLDAHKLEDTITATIEMFINNRKMRSIGDRARGQLFYMVAPNARQDMLYYKNTCLHHFIVPWMILQTWQKVFDGTLQTEQDLFEFFQRRLKHLRYEFFIPPHQEFMRQVGRVAAHFLGHPIENFQACLSLSFKEFYLIAANLGCFANALNYVHQGYYLAALSIAALSKEQGKFDWEDYFKRSRDIFHQQQGLGRGICYPESFSVPLLKQALRYFAEGELLKRDTGTYAVADPTALAQVITEFAEGVNPKVSFAFRSDR
ncbi:MAG: 1-acyl-sn-glycerol-3-phosphate acyltransferase [Bacteriovoracaceae bacterium]|nr:1-acyl-sn-glycerol-3-phosphate acyltransferase [Bacteriovoracaceae bacterium]